MNSTIAHQAILAAVRKHRLLPEIDEAALARLLITAPAGCVALSAWLRECRHLPPGSSTVLTGLLPGPDLAEAFPGYRPLAHLATGGMGTIWLAADGQDELVVIKTLSPELRASTPVPAAPTADGEVWLDDAPVAPGSDRPDGDPHQRLERETRITRSLDHPHIVHCLDSGVSPDGGLFLVLEFMAGGDLKDLLTIHGPLPEPLVLSLARQIASALAVAAAAELVHRDLKPANIFLAADGRAKLADFGFARSHRANRTLLTMAGSTLGSPLYMAPEQIAGETTLDGRCDLYGLGCVLYHCLTGQPPFTGSLNQVLRAHCVAPVPDLAAARPGLQPATVALVTRLLAKKPSDRWPSAVALATAITAAQRELGLDPAATVALPHRPHPKGTGQTTLDLPAPRLEPVPAQVPAPLPANALAEPFLTLCRGSEVVLCCWHLPRLVMGKLRGSGVELCLRSYPESAHQATDIRISRSHLALTCTAETVTLTDLGSANGTTCETLPLTAHQPRILAPGQRQRVVLAQTLTLDVQAIAARPTAGIALTAGAFDAVMITRPLNRPTLAYALVARCLSVGPAGSDFVIPGTTTAVTLAWSADGWWASTSPGAWQPVAATTTWTLGGERLWVRPGRADDL